MYRFKLSRELLYPPHQVPGGTYQLLKKDTFYVIESIYLKELIELDPLLEAAAWTPPISLPKQKDAKQERLLLIRGYGIGDILFVTPLVRQLKKQWPSLEICVALLSEYQPIFEKTSGFDAILPLPISEQVLEGFDHIISLEDLVERHPQANQLHIVELFAQHMGLTLDDKSTLYQLPEEEKKKALKNYPKGNRLRIGLQLHSSSPVRSYPQNRIYELIQLGIQQGWEWVVMGSPGSCKSLIHPQVINMTAQGPGASVRESIALITTCDGFIGPDSALIHFAGALKVPTVALYGSFDSKLRVAHQSFIKAIQATGPCAPCFHHSKPHLGTMPNHCPGKNSLKCTVLESIEPQTIINTLLDWIQHAPCHA